MAKLIYLEPDEEITDVIDKISKADDRAVSLVIPRGSTLANSVVNLKLLSKRGKKLNKDVSLVTNDKIAHNLASQIGLPVFSTINEAKSGALPEVPKTEKEGSAVVGDNSAETTEDIDGIKVHKYDKEADDISEISKMNEDEQAAESLDVEDKVEESSTELEVIEAVKDIDQDADIDRDKEKDFEQKVEKKEMIQREIEPSDFKLEVKKPEKTDVSRDAADYPGKSVFSTIKDRKSKRRRKIFIASVAVCVIVFIALYILIPSAKVVIAVVSEPFSSETNINISKDENSINFENKIIPGTFLEKEDELEKQYYSSGEKNVGAKATGKITVYNNWDQQPISLPAGTTFSSSNGVGFVSTAAVTIPGAQVGLQNGQFVIIASGTADVNVEALDVGEKGNIGPSDFVITSLPKVQQSKIYGKSSQNMSGGNDQMVKIVTAKDLANAKSTTETELKESLFNSIKEELGDGYKLLDSAVSYEIISESFDQKEGDQSDNFNCTMKIKIQAIGFSEEDFRQMLIKNAQDQLPDNREIVSDKIEDISYEVVSSDIPAGKLELKGRFDGYIANKYDNNAIKSDIRGKSINNARKKITSYDKVSSVDIITSPRFIHSLPYITRNIAIEYNYGNQ